MAVDKNSVMKKVQQFTRKGQWDNALDEMKKLYSEDKSDPMITLRMGDLYLKAGDRDKASLSYYKTAGIFAEEGHVAKAIAAYKMIQRIDPDYGDVDERLEKLAREKLITSAPRTLAGHAPARHSPAPVDKVDVIELSEPPPSDPVIVQGSFAEVQGHGDEDTAGYGNIELGGPDHEVDESLLDEGLVGGSGIDFTGQSGEHDLTNLIEQGGWSDPDAAGRQPENTVEDNPAETGGSPSLPATGQPIPLFSEIPKDELWEMLGRMKKKSFADGELIVREGEEGNSLYIIKRGGAKAVTRINGIWVQLAELGERDFFGEVSILTSRPRTADVVASGETEVLELTGDELRDVIDRYPTVEGVLRTFYENRLSDTLTTVKAVPKDLIL